MRPAKDVVGAIFVENGKVFAARRGDSKYPYVAHKYEFVGGKQEDGETLPEALVRELREEMGLEADVLRPYVSLRHDYPDFSIVLHTFLCRMRGQYRLLEHESATWIALCDLDADEWAPADSPIIEKLKKDGSLL